MNVHSVMCMFFITFSYIQQASQFSQDLERLNKTISKTALLTTLFDAETDRERVKKEIEELEQMLAEYKKKL